MSEATIELKATGRCPGCHQPAPIEYEIKDGHYKLIGDYPIHKRCASGTMLDFLKRAKRLDTYKWLK